MSISRMRKTGRGVAAVILAVGLALSAASCSGGGDDGKKGEPSETATETKNSGNTEEAGGEDEPKEPVAEIKGQSDVVLTVTEVNRDSGGFLTINGELKNSGSEPFSDTPKWGGNEPGLAGDSLAGASLVDKDGKKRYYVLRDTEKRCLCTSGIGILEPGKTLAVYLQFPAPPAKTKQIEFQLPTFQPTQLPLTDSTDE